MRFYHFLETTTNDEEEDPLPMDDGSTVWHTVVSGGPVEPNYAGMTVAAANREGAEALH